MAYALGIVALVVAGSAGSAAPVTAIAVTGIALGCSVAFNPLVGGIFALTYGLAIVADGWRRPRGLQSIARHALAAIPVALALVWCATNQMVEGAAGFFSSAVSAPRVSSQLKPSYSHWGRFSFQASQACLWRADCRVARPCLSPSSPWYRSS